LSAWTPFTGGTGSAQFGFTGRSSAFVRPHELDKDDFASITISLASPDSILSRSRGEVTKPETINYRSYKPEKDGLFCEKIFGPVKDWECHCGKYRGIRYKGIICDRCGVEITKKDVRRKRMGHISLAVPIVHIWYFRSMPSKIGYVLNMTNRDLERVIYYESYVVINPGKTGLRKGELITEEKYQEIIDQTPEKSEILSDTNGRFVAKMGGDAVYDLLVDVNIDELSKDLRRQVRSETSQQRKNEIIKKLRVIESFKGKTEDVVNSPEWMVLSVIPVVPPDLRPLVPLEGGRFATSDLNDLYRRVIIRNNRLKKLIDIKAPEVILRNEKRMLQEAVDSLFDNSRKAIATPADGNRPLKSLSDNLKGKQGRFRQNLLGKRVDYSGRSVIVVGPELKLHECGLPKEMAVELFKPFIIRKLIEREYAKTVKSAKRMVERKDEMVWGILEGIIQDHPVLLNRAPTLHRLGIQAFQPILIEGKAIRLHPLVCAAFNADFDGDQMAVHIPLSYEAQTEAWMLMLSSKNILHPASGKPIAIPSQDMVLGCYYLTKYLDDKKGEGKLFNSFDEVIIAFNHGVINLHSGIKVRYMGKTIDTTVGRVLFNQILPDGVSDDNYFNELLTKKRLEQIIAQCHIKVGNKLTADFLDNLKELGFKLSTKGGLSVGIDDVEIPPEKEAMVELAAREVETIQNQYESGVITDGERYNKIIDIWTHTTAAVSETMFSHLRNSRQGFNPIYMMADSGARGSKEQIRQLAGMRGLMAKPQKTMTGQTGEIIESPIIANFKEGLSVLEYFISTHGARKGLADTALKTADAGYLTRRLVDVSQDVIIKEVDCGTMRGIEVEAQKEGEEVTDQLVERVVGRVAADDVLDPYDDTVVVNAGEMINDAIAAKIIHSGVEKIRIRSVLTCETDNGVCAMCYGKNLTTNRTVEIGEAVGVMAAQSIGEPGTQLTLRTFHIGGTASRIAAQSQVVSKHDGKIIFDNVSFIRRKASELDEEFEGDGQIIAVRRNGVIKVVDTDNRVVSKYTIPYGATIVKEDNDEIKKGELLFHWDPYSAPIIATADGYIRFMDIKEEVTYREEVDELMRHKVIIETKNKKLNPHIHVVDENGEKIDNYIIPVGARILVNDGDRVSAGNPLVKIPREASKTKDITGGLPRVAELFEARRPKEPAIVSEIDGVVEFRALKRGVREIVISSETSKMTKRYLIPYGKHILVHDGDFVHAGERLTEGSIAPQDILNILGPGKVQEYLVNEIQDVYRLQGVRINDKHIEVIVRQMMQKVRIEDPGDTEYLEGDQINRSQLQASNLRIVKNVVIEEVGDSKYKVDDIVEKTNLNRENRKLRSQGLKEAVFRPAKPAIFKPILLGITQAALSTDSFISAASFQETTRVLTEAAIEHKSDTLLGLKENVIMGHLIPAGTGLPKFQRLRVTKKSHLFEDSDSETTELSEVAGGEESEEPAAAGMGIAIDSDEPPVDDKNQESTPSEN